MKNTYFLKTFLRYDDGNGSISYNLCEVGSQVMRNRDFATKLARSLAEKDESLRNCLSVTDGYAVVVYENGKPYRSFEHDGVCVNERYRDEIAEQLW